MEREEPCAECLRQSTELTAAICKRCGAYPEDCSCMSRSFAFTRNISCFIYEKAPRNLLLRFKLRNNPQLAEFISRRMYYHIRARYGDDFDCIAYVPQTYLRSLKRGYCPPKILAEQLAERLGKSVVSPLRRTRNFQQKYLGGAERWANARRSHSLKRDASVSGRVLLVDDLFTTGATLNACAEQLKMAGAEEVLCATFAIKIKKS